MGPRKLGIWTIRLGLAEVIWFDPRISRSAALPGLPVASAALPALPN